MTDQAEDNNVANQNNKANKADRAQETDHKAILVGPNFISFPRSKSKSIFQRNETV